MGKVNKINIKQVKLFIGSDNKYYIRLNWDTDESPQPYTGDFWAIIYEFNCEKDKKQIIVDGVNTGIASDFVFEKNSQLQIAITADNDPEKYTNCNQVPILMDQYENICVDFEGKYVKAVWNKQDNDMMCGELSFSSQSGASRVYEVESQAYHKIIEPPLLDYEADDIWEIAIDSKLLNQTDGWVSWGLPASYIKLFTYQPQIYDICIQKTEKEINISVTYMLSTMSYDNKNEISVIFILTDSKTKNVLFETTVQTLGEEKDKKFINSFKVSDLSLYHKIHELNLGILVCSLKSVNRELTNENIMPLFIPTISLKNKEGRSKIVTWDKSLHNCNKYIVNLNKEYYEVYNNCFEINDLKEFFGKSLSVRCVYDNAKGPESEPFILFNKGFYPVQNENNSIIRFYESPYEGSNISIVINESLFNTPIDDSIKEPPFEILYKDGEYILTIDTLVDATKQNFSNWITKLIEKEITIYGFYQIRELCSRLVTHNINETLYYYSKIEKTNLLADIMPGNILYMETANYTRQSSADDEDNNGFVRGSSQYYTVSLTKQGNKDILEFNSFLDYTMGSWGGNSVLKSTLSNAEKNCLAVGGLIDFFHTQIRLPFMRILFPGDFFDSSKQSSLYPSDNIVIAASESYSDLPESVDEINGPYMIIRGRSSITINITIFVNNNPITVALGTSLVKLLHSYGISSIYSRIKNNSIRIWRETGKDGCSPMEIFLSWSDINWNLESFMLLNGDRIEV